MILVARVSGELLKVCFEDGDLVKAGQLLYQLDDLRYEANVKVAEANIARCEASLAYSKSNFARIDALYKKNVTTLDAMESARMQYHADEASLASAKAALITAKDDYKNTKIVAPIDGKISITNYTIGNYLTPSSGTLATLVQVNPIRLSFSISNRDFQQLFGTEENFKRDAKVTIRLADGKEYGEIATFDFINNEANRSTDTLQFYMLLKNDKYQLIPNSTVTVNVLKRLGGTYAAIPLSALISAKCPNLLAAGGLVAAEPAAFASIRVQAQCMATGQAAGTAAALSARAGCAPKDLDASAVVACLRVRPQNARGQ